MVALPESVTVKSPGESIVTSSVLEGSRWLDQLAGSFHEAPSPAPIQVTVAAKPLEENVNTRRIAIALIKRLRPANNSVERGCINRSLANIFLENTILSLAS